MATYAIGDIQGCCSTLEHLLKRIDFRPGQDRLWFAGDLVNRGPDSAGVLRLVRALGDAAVTVLGNHDLRLLAIYHGVRRGRPKDTLDALLAADDAASLMTWLQQQPLVHRAGTHTLLHAGVVPQWTSDEAHTLSLEVQDALRGAGARTFLAAMNDPQNVDLWSPALSGSARLVFICKVLTYLRVCAPDGRVFLDFTGEPQDAPAPYVPWFIVPTRKSRDSTIVCGHWSALGLHLRDNVRALDTGCVWGKVLTAYRLDDGCVFQEPAAP